MNQHDIITIIASFFGASGLLTGLSLWYKRKPEAGAIIIKTAEGVVLMQAGMIKELRSSLDEAHVQIKTLKSLEAKLNNMSMEMGEIRKENIRLKARLEAQIDINEDLRARIRILEEHDSST